MNEMQHLAKEPTDGIDVRWDVAFTLAQISEAVYLDPADQVTSIQGFGATAVEPVIRGSSECVVASNAEVLVIAFRGTKGVDDMITDIKIFGDAVGGGRMHRGFVRSVRNLYDDVIKAARRQDAKNKRIWISGHSLGGAMAAAFAYELLVEKHIRATGVMTFGQPLVMSHVPAQLMLDEFQGDYVRFVNHWDCVSRMLPNYRHSGARVHLKDGGYTLRNPMIAFSAAPGATTVPPSFQVDEDEAELQLMTEVELQEFERNFQSRTNALPAVGASPDTAFGAWWDPFAPHYMASYLTRLRAHLGRPN